MEKAVLFISPQRLTYGVTPTQNVMVKLEYDAVGGPDPIAPNLRLALELTPAEAREVADALRRMADEVEARGPPTIQ